MQITTADSWRVLRKLNFELSDCKHHVRGFFTVDGKKVFPVHFSFGNKDLPGNVPQKFRKSLHLSESELRELIACHIDRKRYEELLHVRGVLPLEPTEAQ